MGNKHFAEWYFVSETLLESRKPARVVFGWYSSKDIPRARSLAHVLYMYFDSVRHSTRDMLCKSKSYPLYSREAAHVDMNSSTLPRQAQEAREKEQARQAGGTAKVCLF